jgi:hypothetical protein
MSQKKCNKSKNYQHQQHQQHQRQRGGVKSYALTTSGTYAPIIDDSTIIRKLFSDCDNFEIISADSATGFIFVLNSPANSKIRLESSVVASDTTTPLSQKESKHRAPGKGLLLSKCCVKISLVQCSGTDYLDYNGVEKSTVSPLEARSEAANQKQMYEASVCGAGMPGVFIPDVIADSVMTHDAFSNMVNRLLPAGPPRYFPPTKTDNALKWIIEKAITFHYGIHVFCMELIGSPGVGGVGGVGFKTFEDFCNEIESANPGVDFPPETIRVACKAATAIISTFVKSSFWSYDTHRRNIMTNGILLFLLDFGRIYHISTHYPKIKDMFQKVLILPSNVLDFFGATDKPDAEKKFDAIYGKYTDQDRSQIAKLFTFNPAIHAGADQVAIQTDIHRVHSNIFELLSLFALIDGMTNHFKHKKYEFQCDGYMSPIFFTRSTFENLTTFFSQCASTLDRFEAVCKNRGLTIFPHVTANMHTIATSLQDALVPCAAMGAPIQPGQLRLPPIVTTPLSPDAIKARAMMMEAEEERRLEAQQLEAQRLLEEAQRLEELQRQQEAQRLEAQRLEAQRLEELQRQQEAQRLKEAQRLEAHLLKTNAPKTKGGITPQTKVPLAALHRAALAAITQFQTQQQQKHQQQQQQQQQQQGRGGKLKKTVSIPKRKKTNAKCRGRLRYAQKRRRTRRRGYSSKSRHKNLE